VRHESGIVCHERLKQGICSHIHPLTTERANVNTKRLSIGLVCVAAAGLAFLTNSAAKDSPKEKNSAMAQIARGKYLVNAAGCNDCHTPKVMSPKGPVMHPTKTLSGFQSDQKLPEIPSGLFGPDKWGGLTNNDLTAWVGPWGVSFAKNLTPDPQTGIGGWTEAIFMKAMRTGKDMGAGRDILPPMPWQGIGQMTDQDLKDIFAYLKSLKPIVNKVPEPIPPGGHGK